MNRRLALVLCVLSAPVLFPAERLSVRGVPNFWRVDEHVYRGAQPSEEGFRNLAKLGIKTIIDLRGADEHRLNERHVAESLGMRYVNIPMRGFERPSNESIQRALELLGTGDSSGWPVFVHCRLGKDRTGTVIACYRIAHERWQNKKALAEARSHGMAIWQRAMQQYVLSFAPAPKEGAPAQPLPTEMAGAGK